MASVRDTARRAAVLVLAVVAAVLAVCSSVAVRVDQGPSDAGSRVAYNYDTSGQHAPANSLAAAPATGVSTGRVVQAPLGAAHLWARSMDVVAAEGAPRAIEASTRVNPWAGNTLSRVAKGDETMYRVWGGKSGQAGDWLTPIRPTSSAEARAGLALPGENAATYVSEVTIPAGTRFQIGVAGEAFDMPGGWVQAQLMERIPLENFGKGVLLEP